MNKIIISLKVFFLKKKAFMDQYQSAETKKKIVESVGINE